jgi:nicotinate-nucleotide adenylyltransferase
MGSDMLLSFTTWHCWQEILQRVTLAGIAREPWEYEKLEAAAEELRQYGRIEIVHVDSFTVSSTKIRELVKNSQDCSCYLPKKIVQYIRMQKLYGGA